MTQIEKAQFISDLCDNVKNSIKSKISKMPEEWDGIELRQLISDTFREETRKDLMKGNRGKDYQNVVITRNL